MQDNYQGSYAPPLAMPSERADVIDKVQPKNVVEDIRQRLLGKEKVKGRWVDNPFMKERRMSEVGAWEICSLMTPASSQNTALTKFNSNQIKNRLLNIAKTAQFMCLRNWQEYNMKGVDKFWFVHEVVFTNSMASLNQPEGEGMRKFIGSIGSGEIGYSPESEQPKGIMGLFRK
jgi:hypothetical protein